MRFYISLTFVAAVVAGCASLEDRPFPNEAYVNSLPTINAKVEWVDEFAEYGVDRFTKLMPQVDNGSVYLADRKGTVQRVSIDQGEPVWTNKLELPFAAGPNVISGQVLLGTRNADVLALDAETGNQLWRSKVSSEVITYPTRVADIVIVKTIDGHVSGLDADTGKQVWTFSRQVPVLSLRGNSAPLIVDDKVIVGLSSGRLVALSAADGKVLWESSIAVPRGRSELERVVDIDGAVLYDKGTLYAVSYQGRVAAVTIESGRILWTRDMSSFVGMSMSDEYLYITDSDGKLWAMDKANGATLWMQDKLEEVANTTATIIGDRLLVGDIHGNVYMLKAVDGSIVGRLPYLSLARATGDYSEADTEAVKKRYMKSNGLYDFAVVGAPQVVKNGFVATYRSGVVALVSLVK